MERIKDLLYTFSSIATGTLFSSAVYTSIFFKDKPLNASLLWQILVVSFVCCLGNFLYPSRVISRKQIHFIKFLHYLYINLIVIGGGVLFDWFNIHNIVMVLSMVLFVTIVFLVITWLNYKRTQMDSMMMNERLHDYQKKDMEG